MNLDNWIQRNQKIRERAVITVNGENKYLLANFSGTLQQIDIQQRSSPIQDFYRVKMNVRAWSPVEAEKKGRKTVDFHQDIEVLNSLKGEFDIPYWALTKIAGCSLNDYNQAFTYQLKACNERCPWCYVDDSNKVPAKENGEYFSVREIMDVFSLEREKQNLNMIRSSGGEPTLVIEQWLEVAKELKNRGQSGTVCLWGDTNLTTGHFIDYLEEQGIVEENIREKIGEYNNPQILCSFKGTDTESFLRAAGFSKSYDSADKRFEFLEKERWYSFGKLVNAGIDSYPFVYDPNPETVQKFMETGAKMFGEGFFLKTWIFPLKLYEPGKQRLADAGINPEIFQKELDERFKKCEEIMQDLIWKKFGINYKMVQRPCLELKVRECVQI